MVAPVDSPQLTVTLTVLDYGEDATRGSAKVSAWMDGQKVLLRPARTDTYGGRGAPLYSVLAASMSPVSFSPGRTKRKA